MMEKEACDLTKFDGTNFDVWKFCVLFALQAQDLIEFVEGTDTEPDRDTQLVAWKIWKKSQRKTSVMLLSSIIRYLHLNLINCATPKEI